MRQPRVYTTEAVVLRRTDFGEADRILTLFTPQKGKVRAIAKGVRRTTSRMAGHLEPFGRAQLLLATGRELDIVTQAEARERLEHLNDDLWHSTAAWYCAELVDRFLQDDDPHPRLYALFTRTLRLLDQGAAEPAASRGWLALRYFELHLLGELGYRPALHNCVSCDTPLTPVENGYNPTLGGALCPNCSRHWQRRITVDALKVLRLLQTAEWDAVPRLRLEPALCEEMDAILQATLRYHLDRDLKAWNFLHARPGARAAHV
jgi:DNA repair protein RecO (recombination protein O)